MAATSFNKEGHKNSLQTIILTAVYNKHIGAVTRALEVIQDQKLDEKKLKDGQREGKQILDFLPQKNAPVSPDRLCHSPLMLACELENEEMVRLLLDEGASAAFKNKEGLNALHIACNKGNQKLCELLIEKAKTQNHFGKKKDFQSDLSILINPKEKRGWTPLMYAIKKGSAEIVQMLMETENVNYSTKNKREANCLHIACGPSEGSDRTQVLRLLVIERLPQLLIQDDCKELFVATDKKGWNIFHYACSSDVEIDGQCLVQWLMANIPGEILTDEDKLALLTQKSKADYSPLLIACEYQKLRTVEYLASRGDVDVSDFAVDRSRKGKEERTGEKSALHLAAIHDSREIARVLVDKGCKIDRVDSRGDTVLHLARKKSSEQVERFVRSLPGSDRLQQKENLDGQLPEDVESEDVIPPEITKRGPKYIERYRQALRQGKQKIPRCGLLFLGEERKGKTSLYKLLVGKEFDPEQKSTHGIDNNEVDTVDERLVTLGWKEKTEEDQQKERDDSYTLGIVKELPEITEQKKEAFRTFETFRNDSALMQRIESINSKINKEKKPRKIPTLSAIPFPQPREDPPYIPLASIFPSASQSRPHVPPPVSPSPQTKPPPKTVTKPDPVPVPENADKIPKPQPKPKESATPKESIPKKAVTDPAPKTKTEFPPQTQRKLSLSSRTEAKSVNSVLKRHTKKEHKEPTLLLNVLDFAGQKNYRPMHHCFIRRRSMYLVVFNLQDMKEKPDSSCDSARKAVEEIRYWLHSIHAHIYPPEVTQREQDEHDRRVILVGTHRNPGQSEPKITEKGFSDIDAFLKDEIIKDDRFVNHVRHISGKCYISVENSLSDPIESGADELRRELNEIKGQLKFLDEDYPLSWLRFEGRLIEMKKDKSQMKCIFEADLKKIAERRGVPTPNDALEFFHDTGNIILLRRVSKLFLSEEEASRISDLAIIDPKWLIKVMQVVVKLPENCSLITGKQQRDLENGVITLQVLKKLWSDQKVCPLPEKSSISAEKLCIILQAYCLIHPAKQPQLEDQPELIKSFIIPSSLPDSKDPQKLGQVNCSWISFYFDFEKFLPLEVYHRLICMFIAKSQHKTYELSSCLCRFDKVEGCKWKIELEAYQHRIKISVIISRNSDLKPSNCIKIVHDQYLKRICKESELQGLKYHGGLLLPCKCEPERESVFKFVSFDISEESEDSPEVLECSRCYEHINSAKKCSISDVVNETLQATDTDSLDECASSTGKRLTIDELMQRKGLQESDLDQKIQKKDTPTLASYFDDVDPYIDSLDLCRADEGNVNNEKVNGIQAAMSKALKLWIQSNPFKATYRTLLNIVLNLRKGDVAISIAQHICELNKDDSVN